jgi:hypothetical protein
MIFTEWKKNFYDDRAFSPLEIAIEDILKTVYKRSNLLLYATNVVVVRTRYNFHSSWKFQLDRFSIIYNEI